jgi:hypothetical protein
MGERGGSITRRRAECPAYHEAGHAVVCLAYGMPIDSASIVPDESASGYCRRKSLDNFPAWELITVALAGPIAETRFGRRQDKRASRGDRRQASELAGLVCGSDREAKAFLRWRSIVAESLVDRHWPAIQAVAALLVERQTVYGWEIEQALQAAGLDGYRWRPYRRPGLSPVQQRQHHPADRLG